MMQYRHFLIPTGKNWDTYIQQQADYTNAIIIQISFISSELRDTSDVMLEFSWYVVCFYT